MVEKIAAILGIWFCVSVIVAMLFHMVKGIVKGNTK